MAKPFLKWAGGKGQLLNDIEGNLPEHFTTYIEPFVGSGAVMFDIIDKCPFIERVYINDINIGLVNTYISIRDNCDSLIELLLSFQEKYTSFDTVERQVFYYKQRDEYNLRPSDKVKTSALFIFLNRTCFNGLYRVNAKNYFNVPHGKYANPKICDEANLKAVSKVLQRVEIFNGDYSALAQFAVKDSFVYLDPPYKPISDTSSFNSYSSEKFDDSEQIRLRDFCDKINAQGASFMLSNSDPLSANPENNFFDLLYSNYHIQRVRARRNINANGSNRGAINELLITNYQNGALLFG